MQFEFVFSKTYLYIIYAIYNMLFQYEPVPYITLIIFDYRKKHFQGSKRIILQLTMVYVKQFES